MNLQQSCHRPGVTEPRFSTRAWCPSSWKPFLFFLTIQVKGKASVFFVSHALMYHVPSSGFKSLSCSNLSVSVYTTQRTLPISPPGNISPTFVHRRLELCAHELSCSLSLSPRGNLTSTRVQLLNPSFISCISVGNVLNLLVLQLPYLQNSIDCGSISSSCCNDYVR